MRVAPLTIRTGHPVAVLAALATGCDGVQSALAPASREAARIADLFWWMTAGAAGIWIGVIVLALFCVRMPPESWTARHSRLLIVGGGAVVPAIVLAGLLIYGLLLLPPLVARAPAGSLVITIVGEQWWWRVRYLSPEGQPVETPNEIRLPVGERVQLRLETDNVIHSFWLPSLAGKMDMIPGRVTYLSVEPAATGVFRGACAEYCGASHALMGFYAEVVSKADFKRWVTWQASPARAPEGEVARRGEALFLATGCSACHTVRGTAARGTIGPDLTHVASRRSLGAAALPNRAESLLRWLQDTEAVKPGVHMPSFGMLPAHEITALAAYLGGLR